MRILVTNDDGIGAEGIAVLVRRLSRSHEVTVVAPEVEQSACSHALSLHRPLRLKQVRSGWWSVDGTPADCVNLAVRGIMKKSPPELVVSGINFGPNLGTDVLYSGTVAGAVEGAIMGIPSVAVSLVAGNGDPPRFGPAAAFAAMLAGRLGRVCLPADTCLNVNVPLAAAGARVPARVTKLGKRRYTKVVSQRIDPRGRRYYWIGGDPREHDRSRLCDSHAVRHGFISVTPLRLDMTAHEHEEFVRTRLLGGRLSDGASE
ncbi:MAG: 5'/3'-nucleotidase SurE [Deltaproteobacteria bacterium]|nr:5'/3'-nucleotidase SurE [Deltaproteobacteria bacterium]